MKISINKPSKTSPTKLTYQDSPNSNAVEIVLETDELEQLVQMLEMAKRSNAFSFTIER